MIKRWAAPVLAAIPSIALSLAIPLVDRFEPSVAGAPFLLVWIVGWILVVPLFLYAAYRLQPRA